LVYEVIEIRLRDSGSCYAHCDGVVRFGGLGSWVDVFDIVESFERVRVEIEVDAFSKFTLSRDKIDISMRSPMNAVSVKATI
jgi:hypothetical protein